MCGEFQTYTLVAIIGGVLVAVGFLAFLVNLIGTVGLRNVIALFVPERWLTKQEPVAASV